METRARPCKEQIFVLSGEAYGFHSSGTPKYARNVDKISISAIGNKAVAGPSGPRQAINGYH